MNKILKTIFELFNNTIVVEKKDLEIDIKKYKRVVFTVKPKKEWFKTLHLYWLKNTFKDEKELVSFLDEHKINKNEFENNYELFKQFHLECKERYSDFLLSEINKNIQ